jgi:FkbM family methyltransferase
MFKSYKAEFENGEVADLLWDGRDEYCFEIIDHEWKFIYEIMKKTVTKTRTAIQAGGNCGLYPLRLSLYYEKVFTFEPDPVNFFCLANNCKNNKIVKINAALGDTSKFVMIGNPQENNNGMPRILNENESGHSVFLMEIDSLNLDNVDLMLLDVEGFEYNALLGASKTLKENSPVIILEITEKEEEINSFLTSLDYEMVAVLTGNTKTQAYIKKS